ncbi:hypothetical protein RB597_008807 [Gaeumannomyces tritici]
MANNNHKFPSTETAWKKNVAEQGLTGASIHNMDHTKSGSKTDWPQFLLCRVLYQAYNAKKFQTEMDTNPPVIESPDSYAKARQHLKRYDAWRAYINNIFEPKHTTMKQRPFTNLGIFSLVRYHQLAAYQVPQVDYYSDDPPKTAMKTRSQTEAARGKATGHPPSTPELPADDSESVVLAGFASLDLVGGGDKPHDSPEARSAISEHSGYTPAEIAYYKASKDEQIVNMALILYLNALTIQFPEVKGDWSLHRGSFVFKNRAEPQNPIPIFEARVDGYFETHSREIAAIVEAKSALRESTREKIRMQEASQFAAWINQHPPQQYQKDGTARRLMISQDRHEIYVTVGTFTPGYVAYITNSPQTKPRTRSQSLEFLNLTEYGPFSTIKDKHMEVLGRAMLAFCTEAC